MKISFPEKSAACSNLRLKTTSNDSAGSEISRKEISTVVGRLSGERARRPPSGGRHRNSSDWLVGRHCFVGASSLIVVGTWCHDAHRPPSKHVSTFDRRLPRWRRQSAEAKVIADQPEAPPPSVGWKNWQLSESKQYTTDASVALDVACPTNQLFFHYSREQHFFRSLLPVTTIKTKFTTDMSSWKL